MATGELDRITWPFGPTPSEPWPLRRGRLGTGTATWVVEDLAMLLELLLSGRSIGYEPSAIVHHRHRRSMEELEDSTPVNDIGFSAMVTSIGLSGISVGRRIPRPSCRTRFAPGQARAAKRSSGSPTIHGVAR